jgi:hypothetical protein
MFKLYLDDFHESIFFKKLKEPDLEDQVIKNSHSFVDITWPRNYSLKYIFCNINILLLNKIIILYFYNKLLR